MGKLKIVSDGTIIGTDVLLDGKHILPTDPCLDLKDQTLLKGIEIKMNPDFPFVTAKLTFVSVDLDVDIEAKKKLIETNILKLE